MGGNLVDMVRSQRYLEIIEEDGLIANAATVGAHLLQGLQTLQGERPELVSNARGRGLMCAIDMPDGATRDAVIGHAYEAGMMLLSCGTHSVRFRPPLDVTTGEIDEALVLLRKATDLAVSKSA